MRTRLTVLSDMAGHEWSGENGHEPLVMLQQVARWGLKTVDLKTVLRKNVADLSDEETTRVADAIAQTKIEVYAFSTALLRLPVENGPAAFHQQLKTLDRTLAIARRLRPRVIRLIAAETTRRDALHDSWSYLVEQHAWLLPVYEEAITRIHAAGFQVVIENEGRSCIFSTPQEIVDFFTALGRPERVRLTWDVQNLWQAGTFPTLDVYHQLKPFIGYYHLKGGQSELGNARLAWRAPLKTASWPVLEITRAVVTDGVSPVICLNPSHGEPAPGANRENFTERDLAFIRDQFPEIE